MLKIDLQCTAIDYEGIGKMEKYDSKTFIALMFPSIVIFGFIRIADIRVLGIVPTAGRVLIPLVCIYLIIDEVRNKRDTLFKAYSKGQLLLIVLAIWILYGAISILIMPYAVFHEGMLEIIALILGGMIVIDIVMLCGSGMWDNLIIGLKIAILITLAIGVYEIITGNHMATSRFSDSEFIRINRELFGTEADNWRWYVATTVFFNENDYSAMLAVLTPFLICGKKAANVWMRAVDILMLCISLAILYYNDAFICFVAFILAMIITVLFGIRNNRERVTIVGALIITRVAIYCTELIRGTRLGMGDALVLQVENNELGVGSMALRLNTYRITLYETFVTSKGLGFGAGSYSNYFQKFVESDYIVANPHCFWLEILAEYGILILLLFVTVLVMLMMSLIIRWGKTKDERCISVIASGAALIIASVAPSRYIKTSYLWIPIALAVYLADSYEPDMSDKVKVRSWTSN